jgi:penicillin-binding protein 2
MSNPFEKYFPLAQIEEPSREFDYGIILGQASEAKVKIVRQVIPFAIAGAVLFLLLLGRLAFLQITQGHKYQLLAYGNSIRTHDLAAPRGLILDREGNPLVKNIASFSLDIIPAYLPREERERQKIFAAVKETTNLSLEENLIQGVGSKLEPVTLAENVPYEQALTWAIKLTNLSGITLTRRPIRAYEDITGIAHFLGYTGKISREELEKSQSLGDTRYGYTSIVGKSGLEFAYENVLKGSDGKTQVEVDALGRKIRQLASLPPEPGQSIKLFLDQKVQETISRSLAAAVTRAGSKAGAAVAINPHTGGILGLASFPSFEPEVFLSEGKDEQVTRLLSDPGHPLVNRAIAGVYPPGSTIKPLWAAAALEEGVISPKTAILSVGGFTVGQFTFRDWKSGGHGQTDVKKAIAESVNTFFYAVTGGYGPISGLGIDRLKVYAKRFGIGEKTGIDLPGEGKGFFPDPAWKERTRGERWFTGNTYQLGIGQGDVLVTPVELLIALNSLVNGGELLRPRLVEKIVTPDGETIDQFDKEVLGKNLIKPEHLQVIKEAMRMTVTDGSARSLNDLPVEAAGKTGTAQYAANKKTHAWFFGFAPWQEPEIAILVLVEGGGEGTTAAAPVAEEVFRAYFGSS